VYVTVLRLPLSICYSTLDVVKRALRHFPCGLLREPVVGERDDALVGSQAHCGLQQEVLHACGIRLQVRVLGEKIG
jgi:hypothetical protein